VQGREDEVADARSSRPDQLAGILERAGFSGLPSLGSAPPLAVAGLGDAGLRLAGES
jgi:hypothetical protein